MADVLPLSAADATLLIGNLITKTRPVSQDDLYQALNYGIRKAVLAISAVRPNLFGSFLEPFTLQAGTPEYDVSNLFPPLLRPWRLIVGGNGGHTQVIMFRYGELTSAEFEDAEVTSSGIANQLIYEMATGLFPGITTTVTQSGIFGDNVLSVASTAGFYTGATITMPGVGLTQRPEGSPFNLPGQYLGYVGAIDAVNSQLHIVPPIQVAQYSAGIPLTLMRTKILRIVPQLGQSFTGRFWYVYEPPRMAVAAPEQFLPQGLTRHIDMIVSYGMALLKRALDDPMEARWQLDATEMRSELMQDSEPASGQNTTAFGSALDGMASY